MFRRREFAHRALRDRVRAAARAPVSPIASARPSLECKYRSAPDWSADRPTVAARIPAGSLPGPFRNRRGDSPALRGDMRADPARTAAWRARLGSLGKGPKARIAWTGGLLKTRSTIRSLALAQRVPILRQIGVQFVALQCVDSATEIADLALRHGLHVHQWPEALADYDETAALVAALDLVIVRRDSGQRPCRCAGHAGLGDGDGQPRMALSTRG